MVYSETGSGVIHDVQAVGAVVRAAGRRMIIDAVSAFGALPLDLSTMPEVDAAVFTTNKCLEALPGVAFAVARIDRLLECAGHAGSWSFDLASIYEHASAPAGAASASPRRRRSSPPWTSRWTSSMTEGQAARLARYTENMRTLYDGVRDLGLTPWLPPSRQGPVIVNVHAPADPAWNLQAFVDALKLREILISNFYNTPTPTFRVGCIGAITPDDMAGVVQAMDQALREIGIKRREAVQA